MNVSDILSEFAPTAADPELTDPRRILSAASEILHQGEALLSSISAADYAAKLPEAFNASIGGHYRHCLDHFTSLLDGGGSAVIDYDRRARDVRIETDPAFALWQTRRIRSELERLEPAALLTPVRARCEVSYDPGRAPETASSLGREFVYLIAHAIHHYALISVMARLQRIALPSTFGIAPSTVAHAKPATTH